MESLNAVTCANKTPRLFITLVVHFWLLFLVIAPQELAFVKCYPVSSLQFRGVAFSGSLVSSQFKGFRETSGVERNSESVLRLKVCCVENSNGDCGVLRGRLSFRDSLDAKDRRDLKQELESGNAGDCSIPETEVQRLYDSGLCQWVIDDEELARFSTLQTIVDCSEEGDVILLNTTARINVAETIILSKSLTISAYVRDTQLLDNVFPRAANNVAFSCPRNESLFRIINSNITLANLAIEGCHFKGQVATSAISVDRCQGQSTDDVLHLHHVVFENISNTVGSGVMDVDQEACLLTVMVDVQIRNNICGDVACVRLSGTCAMNDVTISENLRADLSYENEKAVIHLEADHFRLTMNNVHALGNGLRVLYVKDVKQVSISHSNFTQNGDLNVSFGGVFRLDNSNGIISHSVFNNNTADAGGSLSVVESNLTIDNRTIFSNNTAYEAAAIHIEDSNVLGNNITIRDCRANYRGSVLVKSKSMVRFTNSVFDRNVAFSRGGAVYVLRSALTLEDMTFQNNNVTYGGGGAILAEESSIVVKRSGFVNNNATEQNGGAIRIQSESTMNISDSNFKGNSARFGGAIHSLAAGHIQIENCIFENNVAANHGGVMESRGSNATISGSHLISNHGRVGGGVSASHGFLWISNSTFLKNSAEEKCGALGVGSDGVMFVNSSSCLNNTARRGGCACVGKASQTLCASTLFQDNKAKEQYGGAILVAKIENMNISLQLENCTLRTNKAPVGGGIFIERSSKTNEECYNNVTFCGGVALLGTSLVNNEAEVAGSGVCTNSDDAVRVNCTWFPRSSAGIFISLEEYFTLTNLSNNEICPSWVHKDNSSKPTTSLIAFRARKAEVKVKLSKNDTTIVDDAGEEIKISNFKSGDALPKIRVRILDSFGNFPAFVPDPRLVVRFSSPKGLFRGAVKEPLESGKTTLKKTRGYATPGIYTIQLNFTDSEIAVRHISVEVRNCTVGEFSSLSADGVICEQCRDNFFRFTEGGPDECQICPAHANCSAKFIFPENGYWNNHPCQIEIKKCLHKSACAKNDTFSDPKEIARKHQNCTYEDADLSKYRSLICSKGYSGDLCGSCASGYGRSGTFTCAKCWSWVASISIFVASTLWLLALVFLIVRSNLSTTARELAPSRLFHSTTEEQPMGPDSEYPINIEMVRRMCAGVVSGLLIESRPSTPEEETVDLKEVEVAKWKVGEMLKVMVNYTQTLAIAAYLNVDWTASITTAFAVAETIGGFATHAITRSIYCLSDRETPLHGPLFSIVAGLMQPMVVCLIIILLLSRLHRPWRFNTVQLLKQAAFVASVVAYISYFNIAKLVTKVFPCVDLFLYESVNHSSKKAFWAADTSLECYGNDHNILLVLGSFVLLFFTVAFPILALLVLLYHRKNDTLGSSCVFYTLGFMYKAYHKKYVFWESFVLFRKALLSVVLVFSYTLGPELQSQLAAFVLVFSLFLQMRSNPYGKPFSELNDYESSSLFMTSLAFISASFFHHEDTLEHTKILIACLLLIGNISFFLFMLIKFSQYLSQYFRIYVKYLGVPCADTAPFWHVVRVFFSSQIGPLLDSN